MANPPRDRAGQVKPHNDPDIADEDGLLRYINPQHHVYWDANQGLFRISSAAFVESSVPNGGMSVDVERLMNDVGQDPLEHIGSDWGIVRLITGAMRNRGHQVGSDPIPPDKPYHANVWRKPPKPGGKVKVGNDYEWLKKPACIP